ncbi:MAG: hypothetical protein JO171_06430 [Paludibacterium sp.]|uniref:hypothetical protein n=1 Tax=Paludibacterium sp. TaxID=1917523 RepID=UPI0025CE1FA4|nr:hypothetical protein [Paludibacterium sp.]MBV8046768.1 hypothetical protein [Paludibacterium sp.]
MIAVFLSTYFITMNANYRFGFLCAFLSCSLSSAMANPSASAPLAASTPLVASDSQTVSAPSGVPAPSHSDKARIRVFGHNGVGLNFYRNSTCYQQGFFGLTGGESVSGRLGASFASFLGTATNSTIGMPETNSTIHLHDRDEVLSKMFYREFEVAPGEPLTVAAELGLPGVTCSPLAVTFKPAAGKDYEFELLWQGKSCLLVASELVGETSPATLQPLRDYVRASKCP